MKKIERTIKEILDCKTGLTVITDTFFENHSQDDLKILRPKLQEAYKNRIPPIYKCYECLELLRLRGGREVKEIKKSNTRLHFAHYNDTKGIDCSQKTGIKQLSVLEINRKKYRGQQEGKEHKKLKNLIAQYLDVNHQQGKGVSEVIIDKNWKGEDDERFNYKRPDVRCVFKNENLVFEIQLSTTYLSVIEERQWFYKNNNAYIIWVFNQFDENDDTRRFTANDVIFSNNQNAFVLDEEAIVKSNELNELTFKCYFRAFDNVDEKIIRKWEMKWITLEDLIFDSKEYKIFGVDVDKSKVEIEKKVKDIKDDKQKKLEEKSRLANHYRWLQEDVSNLILDNKELEKEKQKIEIIIIKNSDVITKIKLIEKYTDEIWDDIWNSLNNNKPILTGEISSIVFSEMLSDLKNKFKHLINDLNTYGKKNESELNDCKIIIKNIQGLKDFKEFKMLDLNVSSNKEFIKEKSFKDLRYILKSEIGLIFSEPSKIDSEHEKDRLLRSSTPIFFLYNFKNRLEEINKRILELSEMTELHSEKLNLVKDELNISFKESLNNKKNEVVSLLLANKKQLKTIENKLKLISKELYNSKEEIRLLEESHPQLIEDNEYEYIMD
jgi:hypothetical protein